MRHHHVIHSASKLYFQSVDLLILHNYDIFLEQKKKRNQLYRIASKRMIMTIQCDLDGILNGANIFKRMMSDLTLLFGEDVEWRRKMVNDVRQANLSRGVECSIEKVRWKFSPLQSLLLDRCSNANLKLLISIHPLLLLDDKLKYKGEQQVEGDARVNCRS